MTSQAAILFWTALAALGASVSAVIAALYTRLTYRLVRLQTDPKGIVYTRDDPDRPSVIVLVIENIGREVAEAVTFRPSRPIPAKAWGISLNDAPAAATMADGPLIDGIPALGPGGTRIITWGQLGGLRRALGDTPLQLSFTYRCGKRVFTGWAELEVNSYIATDASTRPHVVVARSLQNMAESLAEIRATLRGFSRSLNTWIGTRLPFATRPTRVGSVLHHRTLSSG